ncbi:hypothetical protein [Nonomuraea sp. NPDC049141]|uniref:hypothetical protein n=1 Tax=unclassified Nonomuraea TaxID=2593643 RepID=UPI0033C19B71
MSSPTKRWAGKLAATAAAAALFIPVSPNSALADPGFCGVRNGTTAGPGLQLTYIVRNKCSGGINVQIYFPTAGRYSWAGCHYIPGYSFGYFADPLVTNDWEVRNCA